MQTRSKCDVKNFLVIKQTKGKFRFVFVLN